MSHSRLARCPVPRIRRTGHASRDQPALPRTRPSAPPTAAWSAVPLACDRRAHRPRTALERSRAMLDTSLPCLRTKLLRVGDLLGEAMNEAVGDIRCVAG